MWNKRIEKIPYTVRTFIKKCSHLAYRLDMRIYLVGGIVRDLILGRESFDYDIVVEGDAIELCRVLSEESGVSFCRHHTFGTATVYYKNYKIDFATARKEFYPHRGALPKVEKAALVDDLFRRDFTINAMAVSINRDDYGKLIDLYGGYSDLRKGVVRVMHDNSFFDDPTRMLRAVRFEQRFSFKIEKHTFHLLKEASSQGVLKLIDEQRLRDELILILKEKKPLKYIRRIQNLMGFSFIDDSLILKDKDYQLIRRAERAVMFYDKTFAGHRPLDVWLIYLMALLNRLSFKKILIFCKNFRLRKGEEKRLVSAFEHKNIIKGLYRKNIKKSKLFKLLTPLSFETIVFFYACTTNKYARAHLVFFLKHLSCVKLKVSGHDLKRMHLEPHHLYSKALSELKHVKIEKGLYTKKEELQEISKIFKRLKRKRH